MSVNCLSPSPERVLILLAASAFVAAGPAQAEAIGCPVAITAFTLDGGRYDPLGDGFSGTVTAQVESRTDQPCEAELRLTDISGGALRAVTVAGHAMPIRLEVLPAPGVATLPDQAAARLSLIPGAAPITVRWLAYAQGSELLPPGDYAMEVTARSGDTSLTSQLAFSSPARAQANFAGGGPDQTIDLGVLQPGKRGRAVLQVRANTRPTIALISANRGYLSNVGVPGATVPYSLTLDGMPVNLHSEWRQPVNIPTNQQGQSMQIEVTVGALASAMAGTYRDEITIEVSP